jgi:hypothetical protein
LFALASAAGGIVVVTYWAAGQGSFPAYLTWSGDNGHVLQTVRRLSAGAPPSIAYQGMGAGYPMPHELLFFLPISALPLQVLPLVWWVACLVLVLGALMLWADGSAAHRHAIWPALVSMVVLDAHTHLLAVVGLAALSLAIWAQRRDRWVLVGMAVAIAVMRGGNLLPILAMLAIAAWGRPSRLLVAGAAGAAVMAPAMLLAFIWDPHWPADYISNLRSYTWAGLPLVLVLIGGMPAFAAFQLAVIAAACWLAKSQAGKPLSLDRAALALALTFLSMPEVGAYSALFVLPALVRVGGRPGLAVVPWMASGVAWVGAALLLVSNGPIAIAELTALGFWLLLNVYPLLRKPAQAVVAEPDRPVVLGVPP